MIGPGSDKNNLVSTKNHECFSNGLPTISFLYQILPIAYNRQCPMPWLDQWSSIFFKNYDQIQPLPKLWVSDFKVSPIFYAMNRTSIFYRNYDHIYLLQWLWDFLELSPYHQSSLSDSPDLTCWWQLRPAIAVHFPTLPGIDYSHFALFEDLTHLLLVFGRQTGLEWISWNSWW